MVNVAASQQKGPEFECTGWVLFLRILRLLPVLVWVFRSQHILLHLTVQLSILKLAIGVNVSMNLMDYSYMTQNKGSSE